MTSSLYIGVILLKVDSSFYNTWRDRERHFENE